MGFIGDWWPYTNEDKINLDWVLRTVKKLSENLENFVSLNTIKYANPIQWNITSHYGLNTIVINGTTGTAYISVADVPAGVTLDTTDYWTPVFTLEFFTDFLKTAFSEIPVQTSGTPATVAIPANSVFWVGDLLVTNAATIAQGTDITANLYSVTSVNKLFSAVLLKYAELSDHIDDMATSFTTQNLTVTGDITYKAPSEYNGYFNTIGTKAPDGSPVQILTPGPNINQLTADTSSISVDDFGTVGDGVTDDTAAIAACFAAAANTPEKPVIFGYKKSYKVTASEIPVKNSVDFNGSTIVMGGETGTAVFSIAPSSSTSYSSTSLTASEYTTDSNLFGKVYLLKTNAAIGTRSISPYNITYERCCVVDMSGFYTNAQLLWGVVTKSTANSAENVHSIEHLLTFKNGNIDYGTISTMPKFLVCSRSNVEITDFTISGHITNTSDYLSGVFHIKYCAFVTLARIFGGNPVVRATNSGYVFLIDKTSNVTISDCSCYNASTGESWGCIGATQEVNFLVERSNLNRVDIHYFFNGYYTARNCRLAEFTYPGGLGTLTVDSCVFTSTKSGDASISRRQDTQTPVVGSINIKNCDFRSTSTSHCILSSLAMPSDDIISWYQYGGENLVIDGCYFRMSGTNILLDNYDQPAAQISRSTRVITNCLLYPGSRTIYSNSASTIKLVLNNVKTHMRTNDTFTIGNADVFMSNCDIYYLASDSVNSLRIANCNIGKLTGTSTIPVLTMVGNTILVDSVPENTVTKRACSGNLITASTTTNSAWYNNV